MDELLQEFSDSRGLTIGVDRAAGLVRGVKILGLKSRNGRVYDAAALRDAVSLYEGAKVNVNHPKGNPAAPRDYEDRLGSVRNVRFVEQQGLFGDLQFNPKHDLAERLVWDAEHAPENVGFSHNVYARTRRQTERVVVEAITRVLSVDLVADPATTRSLFEQATPASWETLTLEQLRAARPDLVAALQTAAPPATDDARVAQLAAELATTRQQLRRQERTALIERLLAAHQLALPTSRAHDELVDAAFVESLQAATDDEAVRQLVAARARLIAAAQRSVVRESADSSRPRARDQVLLDAMSSSAPADLDDFVRSITRGR